MTIAVDLGRKATKQTKSNKTNKIPSRIHFAEKVVPQLYEEVKSGVISQLNSAPAIALTTNGWTSRDTQSYETITAHFINDKWDMNNYVLQTRVLGEVHTSHNLI